MYALKGHFAISIRWMIFFHWMADTFALHAVLRSLPPSYKELVDEYVVKSESILFNDFLVEEIEDV